MWFDVAAALAEIEGRAVATPATSATRQAKDPPVSRMSRKSRGAVSENGNVAEPDLARDLFEKRPAIFEHDGGLGRSEAEVLAVGEAAGTLGLSVAEMPMAVTSTAPLLDSEGLPSQPCTQCGGGDYWKPARLPFEGEGWRCVACRPPERTEWRHAVSVPSGVPEAV